ncbi:MAG TPA: hypothetical protein VK594_11890, partial [Streptosporangiaceae bacterium]|nr:hypothetical protein [Streptosporangiaceae bacterium]
AGVFKQCLVWGISPVFVSEGEHAQNQCIMTAEFALDDYALPAVRQQRAAKRPSEPGADARPGNV